MKHALRQHRRHNRAVLSARLNAIKAALGSIKIERQLILLDMVAVELRLGDDDEPIVTGIAIRRSIPMQPRKDLKREPSWPDGTESPAVRPRDVKRLPLSQIAKAAATWVSSTKLEPGSPERELERGKVTRTLRPPRTRPRTDRDFYSKLLLVHDELVARGESAPAKQIAVQMGEPVSKVHVWLHRAKRKRSGA